MEAALRALADESRRTMLETLTGGPATAGELAALLPIARPGVSRHLRVLREAGLVEVREAAQRRVYSLRLAPLAEVEGDLRLGGEFSARFFASGWEGTGRVEACEPPRRLLLLTRQPGQPDEHVIEATLTADGDQTILVWEERGMPLDLLAAYGAGIQVHVEDLAAYLAGRERSNAEARWSELIPAYQDLAANVG